MKSISFDRGEVVPPTSGLALAVEVLVGLCLLVGLLVLSFDLVRMVHLHRLGCIVITINLEDVEYLMRSCGPGPLPAEIATKQLVQLLVVGPVEVA